MKVGLIGLPKSGVTTLFCLFTGRDYSALTNSAKNEVHLGETRVPDSRVDRLAEIFKPEKITYPVIELADIPVELEASGSFSSRTVNSLRAMDAVGLILRDFSDPSIVHPKGSINPIRDLNSAGEEAILTDLIQVDNKLLRIKKEGRMKSREFDFLSELKRHLEDSNTIRTFVMTPDEKKSISGYRFITEKPWLVLINTDTGKSGLDDETTRYCDEKDLPWLKISAQVELEISALDPADRIEFLRDIGESFDARDRFIRGAYRYLEMISFLTVGEDECRAWSIFRGSDAVTAAGRIHSDLSRGFIRADVISYADFMQFKDMNSARKAGKVRLEGKTYIVQDGDIMNIRFSV